MNNYCIIRLQITDKSTNIELKSEIDGKNIDFILDVLIMVSTKTAAVDEDFNYCLEELSLKEKNIIPLI